MFPACPLLYTSEALPTYLDSNLLEPLISQHPQPAKEQPAKQLIIKNHSLLLADEGKAAAALGCTRVLVLLPQLPQLVAVQLVVL